MRHRSCLVLLGVLIAGSTASGDPPRPAVATTTERAAVDVPEAAAPKPISKRRRIVAVAAAIVPGFAARGLGSWLVHEKRTARRLAIATGIGIASAAAGGLPVGLSGANHYASAGIPLVITGGGLFLTTWLADIGVAAGIDRDGTPRAAPPWSVELSALWLHDAFRERGLFRAAGRIALDRFDVGAAAMIDATNDARDGELEGRFRILGAPATGASIDDASHLYVRAALRVHRDDADDVTLSTAELEVRGRLDLHHYDRNLAGSFGELWTGLGVERATYAGGDRDHGSLLLGGFAWGVYLGDRGELAVYYDHRRDSLAGGIAAWRAAGFVGSVGGYGDIVLAPRWALRPQLEVGTAWVTTLALRYRGGAR